MYLVAFGDIHGVQCVKLRDVVDIEAELERNPSAVPITNAGDPVRPSAAQPISISMSLAVADIGAKDIGEGVTHLDFLAGGNADGNTLVVCTCDGTIKLVSGIGADAADAADAADEPGTPMRWQLESRGAREQQYEQSSAHHCSSK